MKIAISATGNGWDAEVDPRFGRAAMFAIATIDGEQRSLDNLPNTQNLHAAQGAGIQAAESVANAGATILLTGHVGPKAFRALNQAGIEIYSGVKGTVADALAAFSDGKLTKTMGADVEGHW